MVRIKHRYLLVNILYSDLPARQSKDASISAQIPDLILSNQPTTDSLNPQAILKGLRAQVTSLFGDCGAAATDRSLQVKYLSAATSTFILRVSRETYRIVWAALTFMDSVPVKNGRPCIFRVVRVSGTMRKVEEEVIRRSRILVLAAKDDMASQTAVNAVALDALLRGGNDGARELAMVDVQDDKSEDEGAAGDWNGDDDGNALEDDGMSDDG